MSNVERIESAHSKMTKSACETGADHGDELGFRHRCYKQSPEEECYICTLLRENAELKREKMEPTIALRQHLAKPPPEVQALWLHGSSGGGPSLPMSNEVCRSRQWEILQNHHHPN